MMTLGSVRIDVVDVDLRVAGEVDLAVEVADRDVAAPIEAERPRQAREHTGLAEGLVAALEQTGDRIELVGLEEVALVEQRERALVAPRQVGVVDVEVREALDRREDAEQPAIAEEVAHLDVDLAEEGLVVVDADAAAGVLEEELEALLLLLVGLVDGDLDVGLEDREVLGASPAPARRWRPASPRRSAPRDPPGRDRSACSSSRCRPACRCRPAAAAPPACSTR